MNWQPIETAPRDGTRVLAWVKGHLVMIADFRKWGFNRESSWVSITGGEIHPQPTHWMPLPATPKE